MTGRFVGSVRSVAAYARGYAVFAVLVLGFVAASTEGGRAQTTLSVQETFEDVSYAGRGWYDTTGGPLSTVERFAGNSSLECRFLTGTTGCRGGTIGRHALPASDSVYVAYYIKHSANWVGSGATFHPHMFYFLTTEDSQYSNLAYNYLDAYVENIGGVPTFLIQDGRNIDQTRINQNLVGVTEQRAVAGCNGDSDGHGIGQCYQSGGAYRNGKQWSAPRVYFDSTPGSSFYKGDWHLVEAYFSLNTIAGGVGQKDGVIRYWYDGQLIMEHTNVVMRTGVHTTMKFNQVVLSPYIGNGSPADQAFWIDNLAIGASRPATPPPPPNSSTRLSPPTNVRIIR